MLINSILLAAGLLAAATPSSLQTNATAPSALQTSAPSPDTLQTVTVIADRGVIVSKTDTISLSNAIDITEALSKLPGLYIGDYGGPSGLKTVSLRGLGSAHTALYVDGVRVGNVQSGQADLGMLGIENFSAAVVDYAQNSISFHSAKPVFQGRPVAGFVRFRSGSFATYEPSARFDFKLSDKISLSAHAAAILSQGNFPYGEGLTRENNDIRQLRGGIDLFGDLEGGDWHAKAFCHSAERGTPGSTLWPSTDRQSDKNAFIQGLLRKQFSPLYTINLSAKAAYDNIFYQSSWGDSDYAQTEFQLNSAHKFQILPWWSTSLSADLQWDKLNSTVYEASRLSAISAVATAIRLQRFQADLALEFQGTFDESMSNRSCVSPSLDLRYTVLEGIDLVAFGRRAYRIPSFNELYYPGYGNAELLPEDAWLTDAGIEWHRNLTRTWSISLKADAFYNYLKNKITSAPTTDNPSIWLPYNIGKVEMTGADLQTEVQYVSGDWKAVALARYSYQSAIDKTPDSYSFGQQIPYIAKHTAMLNVNANYKTWLLDATWNLRSGRRDAAGSMPDWGSLDVTAGKNFRLGRGRDARRGAAAGRGASDGRSKAAGSGAVLELKVTARNLTDHRYELVSGYPMPGRSLMVGIELKF